jgi:cytochrome o ubiquinol oxidase subunit II
MNKNRVLAVLLVLLLVAIGAFALLHGHTVDVLNTKGTIGNQERSLILFALALSLLVVIPVFTMLFAFAWKYREGNTKAKYRPDWDHNAFIEGTWWLIPSVLIIILSVVTWNSSHQLDPYKPLNGKNPLTIQVVALDWKWLFIYPKQNIATVNFVQIPEKTPVNFLITADAPMNSFWIPQLGGQIYAMPGMSTQLHLNANSIGDFHGSSANISGEGFAGMTFTARSSTQGDFNQWVSAAKQSSAKLNLAAYNQLAEPSQNNRPTFYAASEPNLYDMIITKYMEPMQGVNDPNSDQPGHITTAASLKEQLQ